MLTLRTAHLELDKPLNFDRDYLRRFL